MKKKLIQYIIVFTSVSLIGILITQLFWVKESINLKSEQFDNSVRIAVKSILNQLQEQKSDTLFAERVKKLSCRKPHLEITDYIDPHLLDSLMFEELGCMKLRNYYYGVFSNNTGKFVMGRYKPYEQNIRNSAFRFSLKNIYNAGDYSIGIYFPDKTGIILKQMKLWLFFSLFFLLSITAGFLYVTLTLLKQKKISEMKNDFVNNMTHELKTPVATTSLAAEMLLKPEILKDKKRVKKYAEVILSENQRLENLVERVLQVSMLERGKNKYKFKKADVHKLLEAVIESLELKMEKNNIRFEYHPEATVSVVHLDKMHMMNVFFNLIDNAIKYTTDDPHIVVSTSNNKWGITVTVEDNGIGINHAHLSHIFDNFYRVPKGDVHEVRGFGLGLYYAYQVVKKHGGTITVKSFPGKGSRFDVYLPFKIK